MLANEERKRRLMKKRMEEGAAGSTSSVGQEEGKRGQAEEGAQAGSGQVRKWVWRRGSWPEIIID